MKFTYVLEPSLLKIINLFFIAIITTSCSFLIPKPHEMPATDVIFIHDNPRVGDYAIRGEKSSAIGMVTRYEVSEVTDTDVTMRYNVKFLHPDFADISKNNWFYRKLDNNGKVLKAWVITENGESFPSPVAKTNEIGSFERLTTVELETEKPVKTKAGNFKINAISNYIYRADVGLLSTEASCLEYHSKDVPFLIVKREMLSTVDIGAFMTTLEYMKTAGDFYQTQNYMNIYNKATEGNMDSQITMELMEYGFGK